MKNIFLIAISFFLLSCKNEAKPKKAIESSEVPISYADTIKKNEKINPNNSLNCYDYLTELIRSSDFPFGDIKKEKINVIIDEDNGILIRAKIVFDTDGTGTIGWIEYHLKERKLFNSSADLEEPVELKFNLGYAKKIESCKGISGVKTDENSRYKSIEDLYNQATLINLPNKYNYDFIVEEKGFIQVPLELYESFDFANFANYKIAKLPVIGNIKPIFFIIYDESGQSKLYLITLDLNYKIIDKLKLYDSEDVDGGSLSTTYEISIDYKVKVKEAKLVDSGSKVIEKNVQIKKYKVNDIGKIENI